MVLIGETGSGKSTQLVQFLADSGVAANESIVCTQPRKIAAISLADRVKEESIGCYQNKPIICCRTSSSLSQLDSGVIFMTDHCLLQLYMNDAYLSGISCIIVDEAHERSLNTDLLLALIKSLLCRRLDLRLIIMSATADANQLSEYFYNCGIFHVEGRSFPVAVRYVPCMTEGTSGSGFFASYVPEVVRMATEVDEAEKEGTILAFLTSQMEVEWACENFNAPSAVALALHGKLSYEEQIRVFQSFPGKRKVIFATNIAETSLTIPGVKYVIDSGMVKEGKFEPGSGMNVLKVCKISKSSANQRTGRAGRTEPGRCYRLYSVSDYESMPPNQEPEIRRVHLGVAVLRILALGIKNVQNFDFVDAPSAKAIDMAIRNLVQLGAVTRNKDVLQLTGEGRYLVKLGIEPRLGKLILGCKEHRLFREGIVLAAVMANASSIFCRVGNDEDKQKSDCLKVQFCHPGGDLFTLLSVYKEWESVPPDRKGKWCWENSINAKSMRRCQDTVRELEFSLKHELNAIIPSHWYWDPHKSTEYDKYMKRVILSSLQENLAMYSGYDKLGYEVALTGHHVQLHPSSSLLIFSQKPRWVVFGELLSISNEYLVCVTAVDIESLPTLNPPPLFDVSEMDSRKLQVRVLTGLGSTLLKRFCGKFSTNLLGLISRVRTECMDERIGIEVNVNLNEIQLLSPSQCMEKVFIFVNGVLEYERKLLLNECMEKCLYHGTGVSSSIALFGAGAEIKHLELEKRYLTVDVYHSNVDAISDKELIMFLEKFASGSICAIHKFTGIGHDSDDKGKWGRITFLTPDAAKKAAELNNVEFNGSLVKVVPSQTSFGGDSFPAVKAKVCWPRRPSNGFAIVKCEAHDVGVMLRDFYNLAIGGKYVRCKASSKSADGVAISGIDRDVSEAEIFETLRSFTNRRILDLFLVRGDAVENPPCNACEEALLKEISPFMPKRNPHTNCCRVQVLPPEQKDAFMKAFISFDGRLHLEAAKALEQLEGKVLPGCSSWQKIKCQQLFHSSLSCPGPVYFVIKKQLDPLLKSFRDLKGTARGTLSFSYTDVYPLLFRAYFLFRSYILRLLQVLGLSSICASFSFNSLLDSIWFFEFSLINFLITSLFTYSHMWSYDRYCCDVGSFY
jgi:ATP-dependent RNA helicase DHX8/PRP22